MATMWFNMWFEDKQSMMATMLKNMVADIEAGYNPMGDCITRQRKDIDQYKAEFDYQMEKLAEKDEQQAERWCYMDMKRRGVIS